MQAWHCCGGTAARPARPRSAAQISSQHRLPQPQQAPQPARAGLSAAGPRPIATHTCLPARRGGSRLRAADYRLSHVRERRQAGHSVVSKCLRRTSSTYLRAANREELTCVNPALQTVRGRRNFRNTKHNETAVQPEPCCLLVCAAQSRLGQRQLAEHPGLFTGLCRP